MIHVSRGKILNNRATDSFSRNPKLRKCVKMLVCEKKERDFLVDVGVNGNKT